MNSGNLKPVLLTTMPKSGTYFFAEVLEELGLKNRYFHVARNYAENLLLVDEETLKTTPTKAKIPLRLDQALYTIQAGEFIFGHIGKFLLNDFFLNRFKIIYAFRDEKTVLQSEFYWFREVRTDMPEKFSQYKNLSLEDHFVEYLKLYGLRSLILFKHLSLWKEMPSVCALDFDKFLSDSEYAIDSVISMSNHAGLLVPRERAASIIDSCKNKNNKTKTNRDRSRNLWTPKSEKIYSQLKEQVKMLSPLLFCYWNLRRCFPVN